ncbi:hypothetical protein [Georgenia yuyongxinii]|uniref:hypothetical protein n=1 Tax=Georgenia yuyongxinii TaxID=2589797 RepID=UPI00163DAE87|nr:hypothetical protein [Georgenia yuyongxinii]
MTERGGPLDLVAGAWTATLHPDGVLADIRFGGHLVLKALMVVVRDEAWGTVPGTVTVAPPDTDDGFEVRLTGEHVHGPVDFAWEGHVVGGREGLEYRFHGRARTAFDSNRIGFVALHPLEPAGRPVGVLRVDDAWVQGHEGDVVVTESRFPADVVPHQPFVGVAGFVEHTPHGDVTIRFRGDTFETEDQRNWSDASFKTYSRPLALPFPVRWQAGDETAQAVRLTAAAPAAVSPWPARSTSTQPSPATATVVVHDVPARLPHVGVTVGPEDNPALLRAEIAALRPHHLRVDVHAGPGALRGGEVLTAAGRPGIPLQVAVHVDTDPARALGDLRQRLAGVDVASVAVFDATAPSTTTRAIDVVRGALSTTLGAVSTLVGTDDNFAELNRNRLSLDEFEASAAVFSLNPGVHDIRSAAVLETVEAVPAMLATARSFVGGPVAVGPVSLRPRRSIYRTGVAIDRTGRDDGSVDDRQHAAFAATWLIAMLASLIDAGAEEVTVFELSGPRGLVDRPGGCRSPAFEVVRAVTAATGALTCKTDDARLAVVALTSRRDRDGRSTTTAPPTTTVLLANRSTDTVDVRIEPAGVGVILQPHGYAVSDLQDAPSAPLEELS